MRRDTPISRRGTARTSRRPSWIARIGGSRELLGPRARLDPGDALIIRALLQYYAYHGDDFKVECPTGSGRQVTLYGVAEELSRRLASIFLKDTDGRRPVYGDTRTFQENPHWRDLLLFYEYFHGDTGQGVGASHQAGWTGVGARTMHLFATTTPAQVRALGKRAAVTPDDPKSPGRSRVTR